jgi:hypothetical protein
VTDPIAHLRKLWQIEPDWSTDTEDGLHHWLFRLEQAITRADIDNGWVSWSATTWVIRDIVDATAALELCNALNTQTAGWAYVFDEDERSIQAITTYAGHPDWEQPYAHWITSALLSYWHADTIADALAGMVRGAVDVSGPVHAGGARPEPDSMFKYLQAMRQRPEWVFSPTMNLLPDMQELTRAVVDWIGDEVQRVDSTDQNLRIIGVDATNLMKVAAYEITAGIESREPFGQGFVARIRVPVTLPPNDSLTRLVNRLNHGSSDQATSLGAFFASDNSVWHEVYVPGFTLGNMQVGRSRPDGTELLSGIIARLATALGRILGEVTAGPDVVESMPSDDRLERVRAAFSAPALDALSGEPSPSPERADRRYLWISDPVDLCHFGIFNPMGPTLTTLQLAPLESGGFALLYLMRHPFRPEFKELARLTDLTELGELISTNLPGDLGSMPEFLWIVAPESIHQQTVDGLWNAFGTLSVADQNADVDLAWEAATLRHFAGRAWDRLNNPHAVPQPESPSKGITDMDYVTPPGRYRDLEDWFFAAADTDNVAGTLLAFPSAWDGAINFQTEQGNLAMFDME